MNPAQWQLEEVVRFWRFVAERHEVFRRRVLLRQPPPWTSDPVLQNVFFTNIYRELDRATRYLLRTVLEPYGRTAPVDAFFNTVVFRFFALPSTFEALGGYRPAAAWDAKKALRVLRELKAGGHKVFTGAFNISNHGSTLPKADLIVEQIDWVHERRETVFQSMRTAPTLKAAHDALQVVPGFAGFMAYEVLIDLCYHEAGVLPFSLDSWAYLGPGAMRGLQTLLKTTNVRVIDGVHLTRRPPRAQADVLLAELRTSQWEDWTEVPACLNGPPLTLEAVEQALCEWAKYLKAQDGGHAKRTFRQPGEDLTPWAQLPARFTDPAHWVAACRMPPTRTPMRRA